MITKILNDDNLLDEEIDEVVTRVKALVINKNNQILLGFSHLSYQFPGGHLEDGEDLLTCLFREIKEETGIIYNKEIYPFYKLISYHKNYRDTNKNRKNIIYYYRVDVDCDYDINKTNYTKYEMDGDFKLVWINLNEVEPILKKSIIPGHINETMIKEMILVLKNFKKVENK